MPLLCPSWLSFILYNPIRKTFTDRQKLMDEGGITADSVVLEVGAGNGFFTEAVAERAKKVIAVELQKGMVRKLEKRLGRFGSKVEIVAGDIADVSLGAGVADVCLLYYCFHEIARQHEAAGVISHCLKSPGTLAIYEPMVEVSKKKMGETVALFMNNGLILQAADRTVFSRFARMRKS
jgi:ubiquinone/menaquinone biosynthesis C-methylase UbiE